MKKTGLIILVVVMALGALGAGYAAWTQTLPINGTLTAAHWEVNFRNAEAGTIGPNGSYVSTVSADGKTLTVVISNVAPGTSANIPVYARNDSSIPVTFTHVDHKGTLPADVIFSVDPVNQALGAHDDGQFNIHITVPSTMTLTDFPSDQPYSFSIDIVGTQGS